MQDKITITKVIGCLLHKPDIILDDNYPLDVDDFRDRFHRIVFSAIRNLVMTGNVQSLDITDIDSYLANYDKQYKIFNDNNGFEYLQEAYTIAVIANFDYYYKRLRKFSLLSRLEAKGFDIKDILDDDTLDVTMRETMQAEFDNMTIEDILDIQEKKLLEVRENFEQENAPQSQAGKDLRTLIRGFKDAPDIGVPLQSKMLNTILRGARLKKLYLRSAASGFGKTKLAVGDAGGISMTHIYNLETKEWDKNPFSEPTLIISTENGIDEVQSILTAFVSGVAESTILEGKCTEEEEERIERAIDIIEESPLWLIQLENFSIASVEATIKKHKINHKVKYVFFDYLFTSISLLQEVNSKTSGNKLREDNILYIFVERMKFVCNHLGVFMFTSTQVNDGYKTTEFADASVLRGAKSLSDKVDGGMVLMEVTKKDLEALSPILQNGFFRIPNFVYHVYKVRRGKINRVKLWIYLDLGTSRTYDCFLTNREYEIIDITTTTIEKILESTEVSDSEIISVEDGESFVF